MPKKKLTSTEILINAVKTNIKEYRQILGLFVLTDQNLNAEENRHITNMFRRCGNLLSVQMIGFKELEGEAKDEAWEYVKKIYENLCAKIQPTQAYFEDKDKQALIKNYKEIDKKLDIGFLPHSFPDQFAQYKEVLNEEYEIIIYGRQLTEKPFQW